MQFVLGCFDWSSVYGGAHFVKLPEGPIGGQA